MQQSAEPWGLFFCTYSFILFCLLLATGSRMKLKRDGFFPFEIYIVKYGFRILILKLSGCVGVNFSFWQEEQGTL